MHSALVTGASRMHGKRKRGGGGGGGGLIEFEAVEFNAEYCAFTDARHRACTGLGYPFTICVLLSL